MNWIYTPFWNARLVLLIGLLMLAIAAFRWWRERPKAGRVVLSAPLIIRLALIAVLLWVICNPQALLPRERRSKPKLILLVDSSASMGTRDVESDSRWHAALQTLRTPSTLAALNQEFILDVRRFDRELRRAELSALFSTNPPMGEASPPMGEASPPMGEASPPMGEASPPMGEASPPMGEASEIGAALMSAVSELGQEPSQAGVLLVSDGRATSPNTLEAAQLALARAVPLWTWTLGGPVPRHDLWIETTSTEALAFSGAEVELAATLRAAGYPNRSFNVELLRDDKVIETKQVLPDTNGVARVVVRVKAPESGEQRYLFRVAAQPDEADTSNNERAVFLRSVGEKVRVLVAEGQPHWDTKFLVQSLKRDPNVDLTAVYRLNATRHVAVVSAKGSETRIEKDLFPRTAEAMNAFDVVVLGRGADAFFDNSTESLLTEYVSKRGGSLVFARGKPYGGRFQPLAKLEPLAWGNGAATAVRLKPTEAGRDNPIFDLGAAGSLDELLERLPALDQASVTLGEKPLAVVLATSANAEGPVLLAYQRYGLGKALSLNASGLWRWSFREIGQEESESAYRRFWVSLLQWLLSGSQFLPGADVALTSARRYYTSEQPMQFLISTRHLDRSIYQPRLAISGAGREIEVEPRARGEAFVAEAGPVPPGTYRIKLRSNVGQPAELTQSVEVINASVEKREVSADPELMRKLAQISGGAALAASDVARLPDLVRRLEAARQLAHRQRPVWDRWWILSAIAGLLGTEWWVRRRQGLL